MKKIVCFMLILLIALSLVGCELGPEASDAQATDKQEEDVILLDNDLVKVTYIGITEIDVATVGYSYLNLRIENKTDTEIWVTMPYCCVDSETVPFVIQGTTAIYITPGKVYPATFGIQVFNLSIDSLKNASKIEFTIKAVEKENLMNTVFEETMTLEMKK